jgi:hypothetical protein
LRVRTLRESRTDRLRAKNCQRPRRAPAFLTRNQVYTRLPPYATSTFAPSLYLSASGPSARTYWLGSTSSSICIKVQTITRVKRSGVYRLRPRIVASARPHRGMAVSWSVSSACVVQPAFRRRGWRVLDVGCSTFAVAIAIGTRSASYVLRAAAGQQYDYRR